MDIFHRFVLYLKYILKEWLHITYYVAIGDHRRFCHCVTMLSSFSALQANSGGARQSALVDMVRVKG